MDHISKKELKEFTAILNSLSESLREYLDEELKMSQEVSQEEIPQIVNSFLCSHEVVEQLNPVFTRALFDYLTRSSYYHIEDIGCIIPEFSESNVIDKLNLKIDWTFEKLMALLTLLMTVIFGIISSLPNKQLEEIKEQNTIIIAQNETLIRQQSDEIDALNQLFEVTKSIYQMVDTLSQNLIDNSETANPPPDECDSQNTILKKEFSD